ncbi:hypothetical protein B0A53_04633 [Rhodotorula sp. CCFEE 5036]|nr:hypothetical protein B0A53_04633 [Rhodotorula sp. CCFEE 5036]
MPTPLPPAAAATAAFPEARRGNAWDDWEEAYTRDEQPQADNVRLWQQAFESNTFRPTYSILPSASNATRLPPAAALSAATTNGPPVLKILKRPTAASTGTPGSASRSSSSEGRPRMEKTLAEREKEYLEARRRIYGEDAGELQTGMAKMSLGAGASSPKGSKPITNTGGNNNQRPELGFQFVDRLGVIVL